MWYYAEQNKTLHTVIHPYSTKEEQPQEIMVVDSLINSSRYSSCRYLVYFPKTLSKYRRLCRLRAWWRVWTVDPRELRGWRSGAAVYYRTPARHLGSGYYEAVNTVSWLRKVERSYKLWLYCIVIVQSWFSNFYKLSMFLTLRKNETKHVNDINIHDSECCVITEQHQHFSITVHK